MAKPRTRRTFGQNTTITTKHISPYEDFFKARGVPIPRTKNIPHHGASYAVWHNWVSDDDFFVSDEQMSLIIDLWMGVVSVPD